MKIRVVPVSIEGRIRYFVDRVEDGRHLVTDSVHDTLAAAHKRKFDMIVENMREEETNANTNKTAGSGA